MGGHSFTILELPLGCKALKKNKRVVPSSMGGGGSETGAVRFFWAVVNHVDHGPVDGYLGIDFIILCFTVHLFYELFQMCYIL